MGYGNRTSRKSNNLVNGQLVTYVVVKREPELDPETQEATGRMIYQPIQRCSSENYARSYVSMFRGQDLLVEYEYGDKKVESRVQ